MDWSDAGPEVDQWLSHQRDRLKPLLEDMNISIAVYDHGDEFPEPRWCIELGYLIMLDKPILILKPRGQKIPLKLRQVANEIVDFDPTVDLDRQADVEAKIKAFDERHS